MKCFPSPSIRDRCKGRGWAASGMSMKARIGAREREGRGGKTDSREHRKKGRQEEGREGDTKDKNI